MAHLGHLGSAGRGLKSEGSTRLAILDVSDFRRHAFKCLTDDFRAVNIK
ncbi:MAG: hypothetical protein MK098_07205 [Marinovum sp.]|nr:hypothetical protein [Marinovum sp.]